MWQNVRGGFDIENKNPASAYIVLLFLEKLKFNISRFNFKILKFLYFLNFVILKNRTFFVKFHEIFKIIKRIKFYFFFYITSINQLYCLKEVIIN